MHVLVVFNWARAFAVFLFCSLSGAIVFLQKPCQSFYAHYTDCIVLLWALLCALYASCCSCYCVRETFADVHDLCCSFMLKLFWLPLLWFSTQTYSSSMLPLSIVCFCLQALFLLRLLLFQFSSCVSLKTFVIVVVLTKKPLCCLSIPWRFC